MSLRPGDTLGILGGGQLGRMLAMAAHRLGLRAHVFAQQADEPAVQVTNQATLAPFDDPAALDRFAAVTDVVTLEFENVPLETVRRLATQVPVRPGADVLAVAQDRLEEKRFADGLGIATAPHVALDGPTDLDRCRELRFPARLKTRRLGYDGHGQRRVLAAGDVERAWIELGRAPAIVETEVVFRRELSVIVARRPAGALVILPLAENRHADGILVETVAPASATEALVDDARGLARRLAFGLDLEGLLAVELFETTDGALLLNELAPRPHNSGHWTLDACWPDQFELAVRAAADWPLPQPHATARARMVNLLGADAERWPVWLERSDAHLHLYGKLEQRPGRKMGHVTVVDEG
ncbi:MAG: 5-(carboxyamino)imidazole ribonucleotide synthase [Pseudomonadota bacterium]